MPGQALDNKLAIIIIIYLNVMILYVSVGIDYGAYTFAILLACRRYFLNSSILSTAQVIIKNKLALLLDIPNMFPLLVWLSFCS